MTTNEVFSCFIRDPGKQPRLSGKTKMNWGILFEHVLESQQFCKEQGDMMTAQELRQHIAKVNRAMCLELNDYWQEIAAKCVEACTGVKMDLDPAQ